MKIEEVKSTIKTQRISAHTHVKGRYLHLVVLLILVALVGIRIDYLPYELISCIQIPVLTVMPV